MRPFATPPCAAREWVNRLVANGSLIPGIGRQNPKIQTEVVVPERIFAVPDAQDICMAVADVYGSHTQEWFVGLVVFGSAVKGGFIPGCSDIDFQLFLKDDAFDPDGCLSLSVGLEIHRNLLKIDPAPFRYIQCTPFSTERLPKGYFGPVPNTYRVVRGHLPVPEARVEDLLGSAKQELATFDPSPDFVRKGLLDHGGGRLDRDIRLLCTKVWPILFHVLSLYSKDPIRAWQLPKDRACEELPEDFGLRKRMLDFYQAVCRYYSDEQSQLEALDLVERSVD